MMSITFADLERLRRELKKLVEDGLATLFGNTLTSSSTPLGDRDAVEKVDGAADPDGSKGQRLVTRVQPFGFASRPPKGLRGFWLRWGSSNVLMIGILPQQSYGPQNLQVGEQALYNSVPGCQQLLDQDGNVKVDSGTPDGGAQGDVVVNGGTAKVSRVGDTVDIGTFAFTPAAGSGVASGGTLIWTPPGGGTPISIPPSGTDLTGKVSSGAANFKG